MSKEKLMILNMLKEGKITEEEALKLLEAIGESSDKTADDKFNDLEENVINRIANSLERFVKKTTDTISNIDFEEWAAPIGAAVSKYRARTEGAISLEIGEMENPVLNVNNKDGRIQIYTWDNAFIDCKGKISYDDKLISPDHEFFSMKKEGNEIHIYPNLPQSGAQPFELNLQIAVPKKHFGAVKLNTTNGAMEVNQIEAGYVEMNSTNGRLNLFNASVDEAVLEATNAKIEVVDLEGKKLSAKTMNGKIALNGLYVEEAQAESTNGSIAVADISNSLKRLTTTTVNGSIRINIANFVRAVKADFSKINKYTTKVNLSNRFASIVQGNNEVTAYTDGFNEEDQDALRIEGSTVNGSINVE